MSSLGPSSNEPYLALFRSSANSTRHTVPVTTGSTHDPTVDICGGLEAELGSRFFCRAPQATAGFVSPASPLAKAYDEILDGIAISRIKHGLSGCKLVEMMSAYGVEFGPDVPRARGPFDARMG